jgi:hypothetical protein
VITPTVTISSQHRESRTDYQMRTVKGAANTTLKILAIVRVINCTMAGTHQPIELSVTIDQTELCLRESPKGNMFNGHSNSYTSQNVEHCHRYSQHGHSKLVSSTTVIVPNKLHGSVRLLNIHPDFYILMQKAVILNTSCTVRVFGR